MIYVLIGLIIGLLAGFIFYHRTRKPYFAHAEYWVYSNNHEMPSTEKLMVRLVGSNPYVQQGQNPIGGAEGLVLSDIRLKIALLLKTRNQNLFDGRRVPASIADQHDFIREIGSFQSIVKLQYISTTKLKDKRHLQFLMHAADATAEICESGWILDKVTGVLRTKTEQTEILAKNFNVTKLEFHARLEANMDNSFSSFGLIKVGIADFDTHPVAADQVQLVREILERYMTLSWERGEAFPDPIKAYDDEFFMLQKPTRHNRTIMRIVRKQMIP